MACSCKRTVNRKYVWTSADGSETMEYPSEIQAKAKVIRKGGSYKPLPVD